MGEKTDILDQKYPENPVYFKEQTIMKYSFISYDKPDIKDIIELLVLPKIESVDFVKIDRTSIEGKKGSGVNLITRIKFNEKLTYISDTSIQVLQAAYFENVKSLSIVVPENINGEYVEDLFKTGRLKITPYIEEVSWRVVDNRTIYEGIMVFANVRAY